MGRRLFACTGTPGALLLVLICLLCHLCNQAAVSAQSESTSSDSPASKPDEDDDDRKRLGDKCSEDDGCDNIDNGICNLEFKVCECKSSHPVTNHIDKCRVESNFNESCEFSEQCSATVPSTHCRGDRCVCIRDWKATTNKEGKIECVDFDTPEEKLTYVDPTMIGVLVGLILMFIILCVVLRLFSKARWRENRTIFNTPNPRLMNVSLLRDSKLERRPSRGSVRGPSRQPSMASLQPRSPTGSRPGSRRGSKSSNQEGGSPRSKSPTSPRHSQINNHHAAGNKSVAIEMAPPSSGKD